MGYAFLYGLDEVNKVKMKLAFLQLSVYRNC